MAGAKNHPYHLVNPSPWPLIGSFSGLALFAGLVMWMHDVSGGVAVMGLGFLGVFATMYCWWADVIREAHGGDHTPVVQLHLRYGMILFIASEVMFFLAWFWAFPRPSTRSARPGRPRAWKCSIRSAIPCSTP